MNSKELRTKDMTELESTRQKLEVEIGDSYMDMRTGKEKDVRKPRRLRKDLAQLNTIIVEKERDKLKDQKKNG